MPRQVKMTRTSARYGATPTLTRLKSCLFSSIIPFLTVFAFSFIHPVYSGLAVLH